SAGRTTVLIQACRCAWQSSKVIEIIVGIQVGLPIFPEHIAVILIGTTLGDEFDLYSAFATALGTGSGCRHGDFCHRVGARTDVGEEAVTGADEVILNI